MVNFDTLPLEIRQDIWEFCLPDDVPEVYFFDGLNFALPDDEEESDYDDEWEDERDVFVGFPVIMHVCSESRAVAQKKLQFNDELMKDGKEMSHPSRAFRPELDVLYVGRMDLEEFIDAIDTAIEKDDNFFKEISHLAVQSFFFRQGWEEVVHFISHFSKLRTISVVFGKVWDDGTESAESDDGDPPPRFRLVEWPDATGPLVYGIPETEFPVQEIFDRAYEELNTFEMDDDGPYDKEKGKLLIDFKAVKMERCKAYS